MGVMHHAGSLNGSPVSLCAVGHRYALSILENSDADAPPTRCKMSHSATVTLSWLLDRGMYTTEVVLCIA